MFAMPNLSTMRNQEQIPSETEKYKEIQIDLEEFHVFITQLS
jgi:hypothetical protein